MLKNLCKCTELDTTNREYDNCDIHPKIVVKPGQLATGLKNGVNRLYNGVFLVAQAISWPTLPASAVIILASIAFTRTLAASATANTESDRVDKSSETQIDGWIAEAKRGELSWSQLAERLLALEHPSQNSHQPDTDRARRCGFGEVIFGSNKTPESITKIAQHLLASGQREVLVTRVVPEQAHAQYSHFKSCRYDSVGRTLRLSNSPISVVQQLPSPAPLPIAVVTAGSTDLPVAREAIETLRWMGVNADLLCDVGVAGPYRLLGHLERLRKCAALVAVAGMEGALASVVGGLVPCPIIAVPTSIGYGANFEGITTLLSMMSSCAAGVTVVNIDAGFKGGYIAGLIAHRAGLRLEA